MSCMAKIYLLMTSSKGEIDPLMGGNENAKENVWRINSVIENRTPIPLAQQQQQ